MGIISNTNTPNCTIAIWEITEPLEELLQLSHVISTADFNTEKRKIIKLVKEYVIANPEISFSLNSDGKEVFKLKKSDLKSRIIDLYGSEMFNNILSIKNTKDLYEIYGFLGNLNTVKKSKGNQYIYVNGRSINSRLLSSAAFNAYDSLVRISKQFNIPVVDKTFGKGIIRVSCRTIM